MELGVTDPVPALKAPAVSHLLQQCFWGGAQAGVAPKGAQAGVAPRGAQAGVAPRGAQAEEEVVGSLKRLAVTAAGGAHLHDPAGAAPCLADVLWSLSGPQLPGEVSAVTFLLIRCHERDLVLSLELTADLTMQSLLVRSPLRGRLRLHRQEEVGPYSWSCRKTVGGCATHPPRPTPPPDRAGPSAA